MYTSQILKPGDTSKSIASEPSTLSWLRRLTIVAFAASWPLAGGEVESWNDINATVVKTERLTWSVAGVARFRDSFGSLYDRRPTTAAKVALNDRWSAVLGYMALNRKRPGMGFGWDQRATTGLTYSIIRSSIAVDGTTLYERHFNRTDAPDFHRYRQQFDVEQRQNRVSPWLHQSFAFRNRGIIRSRSRFGLRWVLGSGHSFRAGYQFESIRFHASWRPRHSMYTSWNFDVAQRFLGREKP